MSMLKPTSLSTFLPDSFRFVSYSSPKLKQALSFPTLGRTKQQFKDECDVNLLMSRYMRTGILGDGLEPPPSRYMDVSSSYDFQEAMNFIADAQGQFYELPATIRARFNNDPGELLSFLDNPYNKQEGIALGLIRDPNIPAPTVPFGTPKGDSVPSGSSSADQPPKTPTI